MSLNLPERASYDYLKKLAKERLVLLRAAKPATKLADAQRAIAREYGFASWRALKAELDRRREPESRHSCRRAEPETSRRCASSCRTIPGSRASASPPAVMDCTSRFAILTHCGSSSPMAPIQTCAISATTPRPLHLAAANAELESVRVLLDAGADAQGTGDVHNGDVIGWAMREGNEAVIQLLLERGARHHIFSAMALAIAILSGGWSKKTRTASCAADRGSRTARRLCTPPSRRPTDVGFLAGKADYAMLSLLIELGADVEAADDKGRTPLAVAMLRGDREAMRLLKAAGAKEPPAAPSADAATQGRAEPRRDR